jgi:hypothetical protein
VITVAMDRWREAHHRHAHATPPKLLPVPTLRVESMWSRKRPHFLRSRGDPA